MPKRPTVYIMTNPTNQVLYIGVTAYPTERFHQHRTKTIAGFTKKYNCTKLVFVEPHDTMESAIIREKQLKGWLRQKKIDLITSQNPRWKDLYNECVIG